jgi:hypothetical protein
MDQEKAAREYDERVDTDLLDREIEINYVSDDDNNEESSSSVSSISSVGNDLRL